MSAGWGWSIPRARLATCSLTGNKKPGGRESHPHHLLFKEKQETIEGVSRPGRFLCHPETVWVILTPPGHCFQSSPRLILSAEAEEATLPNVITLSP
jgi:hypothetical protein